MSSPYPILDNRPIDKWKVTELKEELKRRKLTTRGLKEELVRRLDEALRIERENAEANEGAPEEGVQDKETTSVAEKATPVIGEDTPVQEKATPVLGEDTQVGEKAAPVIGEDTPAGEKAALVIGEDTPVGEKATPVAAEETASTTETTPVGAKEGSSAAEEAVSVGAKEALSAGEEAPASAETTSAIVETIPATVETIPVHAKMDDNLVKHDSNQDENLDDVRNKESVHNSVVDVKQDKVQEGYVEDETAKSESGMAPTESVIAEETASEHVVQKSDVEMENREPDTRLDGEDSKHQPENEGIKAQATDGLHDISAPSNQVSEVSLVSRHEVKSDCISTDSVCNNENKLKDNVIADNVKLEHNVTKSEEMVEPSSVGGESHPMDVEEPLEQKKSVGDRDDSSAANADMTKANDNIDAGDSEKLNLDRSSGDDSMEEEVDAKQTESNNSDEVVNRNEKIELPASKVETSVDIVGNDSVAVKGDLPEIKNQQVTTSEKRKLPVSDQEVAENNEPVKKQRRWNSENIKVPEAQNSSITPTTTPKSTGLNRSFSRSDSTASEDGPKERVVPPSQKDPTNSLRIDRFLRPFTLKAVQELLGKTGTVTSFWMDHIKTHCYVSYSSVEEAVETRNVVYNLQWPPNGGRLLIAEFVDPEEVKAKLEAPLAPTTPAAAPSQPTSQPQPPSRPQGSRAPQQPQQQPPPPTALPPPPPVSNPPPVKERLPPPPPVPEQQEPPIVTLDDLFRKTKATPRIYYLPLSEEQVAAKLAAKGKSTAK